MATLRGVACQSVQTGAHELYEVTVSQVKISEIIIANTTDDEVTYELIVNKDGIGNVVLFPATKLTGKENNIITLSTFLNQGDVIIAKASQAGAISAYISLIEL